MTDDSTRDQWRRSFSDSLDCGDAPPEQHLELLRERRKLFYEALAEAATPAFNAYLRELDGGDLESRRSLCYKANEHLRELGLAVRSPTGHPSHLVVDARHRNDAVGRFRIEYQDDSGQATRVLTSVNLPTFELMGHPRRVEPLSGAYRNRHRSPPSR